MKYLKKKIAVCWLIVAFMAGLLLGYLITTESKGSEANETVSEPEGAVSEAASADPDSKDAVPESDSAASAAGENYNAAADTAKDTPKWEADKVYTGGDLVLFEGKYYKAKWWTQKEIPGQADVWEDTGEAPATKDQTGNNQNTTDKINRDTSLPTQVNTNQKQGFRVVAYYPSWASGSFYKGASISDKVQFDKVTHLVYAFAIPTVEGGLRPLENDSSARELLSTAHEYGVKVLLAIGGWSYNDTPLESTFVSATGDEQKLEKFADSIFDMCQEYGFDGIDLDWEHPRVDGSSGKQYEALVEMLADKLHKEELLLSCAVLSGATADGNIYYDAAAHSDKVLAAVDWINVMAYDGGDGERHSTYEFAVDCGKYWRDTRGVPADKINLGVPFYSRPGWASYENLLEQDPDAWKKDITRYNGMEAWYNGIDTICAKTKYAQENLGGIMIWEITQDTADRDKSLLSAIWDSVNAP